MIAVGDKVKVRPRRLWHRGIGEVVVVKETRLGVVVGVRWPRHGYGSCFADALEVVEKAAK